MHIIKEIDSEGVIRLRSDEGGTCTILPEDGRFRIASFRVPKQAGRKGVGSALLSAAEQEACAAGAQDMVCDFRGDLDGFSSFLKKNGYNFSDGEEMVRFSTTAFVYSGKVLKTLRTDIPDLTVKRLSELMPFQLDDICGVLGKMDIHVDRSKITEFDPLLSYVLFDENYSVKSLLFSSVRDEMICIELLSGFSRTDPRNVIAVCREFVKVIIEQELDERYPGIEFLTMNPGSMSLLKWFMGEHCEVETVCHVVHGKKPLSGGSGSQPAVPVGTRINWQSDIEDIAWQEYISEKHHWL